jgi:hypothetical protein
MAFTALSWTKLSSSQSSVTINIPSGYKDLTVKYSIKGDRSLEDYLGLRLNGVSSIAYAHNSTFTDGSDQIVISGAASGWNSDSYFRINHLPPASLSQYSATGVINLFSVNDTSVLKPVIWTGCYENNVSSGTVKLQQGGGYLNSTSAITSIQFFPLYGSNLTAGTTIAVYGATSS